MDRTAIRYMSLAGNNKEIKDLLISDFNRKVYSVVRDEREVTASEIADEFDISIQHASGSLRKMYKQGYIRRWEQPQESGGFEWVYFL